jgi:hypothetical protein
MSDKNDFDSLVPGNKKSKREKILEQLDELDNEEIIPQKTTENNSSNFLPSSLSPKKKKKNTQPQKTEDEWFNDLIETSELRVTTGKRKSMFDDVFNPDGKKKKKKKKNKNEPTDYEKKFEPEAALLRSLLIDQNKFVDSLQKEYDFLKSNKSTSRGINKNITDLISNITNARNLSMQLIDKNTSLKKTIADLTMKERKELFGNSLDDVENLNDFASTYLKQMISERHQLMAGTNSDISDYSIDEMASIVSDTLLNSEDAEERSDETRKYLEYENRNVTVYVYMNPSDETDYDYVAIDENGDELDDYPLPFKGKLTVNRSTNMATDIYGQKYIIRWR